MDDIKDAKLQVRAPKDVHITTLENGLRVVSQPMTTVETVSVGVWVDTGARNETQPINGISHLLEHMAFKGTKRRSQVMMSSFVFI